MKAIYYEFSMSFIRKTIHSSQDNSEIQLVIILQTPNLAHRGKKASCIVLFRFVSYVKNGNEIKVIFHISQNLVRM